jgi:hypothetical protein
MNIVCRIFGHIARPYGRAKDDVAYGQVKLYTIDNLGTEHWEVFGECDRCGRKYRMARFHGPLDVPPHIAAIGDHLRWETRNRLRKSSGLDPE